MRTVAASLLLLLVANRAAADSTALAKSWELETHGVLPQAVVADPDRKHLYSALKTGGLAVYALGTADQPPKEIARVSIAQLGKLDVMHLAQRGENLYLALGDLFATGGSQAGLAIVNVSNRSAPRLTGLWVSPEPMHGSAIVAVDERHAYLGAMSDGVMIFDIATPASIKLVSRFQPDVDFPKPKPTKVQHPNARGFALAGNTLYVAYDAGGIRTLDITNRAKPRETGRYVNAAMGTKQQAYNNLVLHGGKLYAAIDYAGLEILDATNPAKLRQLGWWNPWKAETPANLWFNSPGHVNQIALDTEKKFAYLSAGDSDLQVVNVADAAKPSLVHHYGEPKDGRGVWGVTLAGDRVYLTYINAVVPFRGTWSGIVAVKAPK